MKTINEISVTICPPAFARGGVHRQVKESTRRRVRRLQREWRENLAALGAETALLSALS